MVRRYPAPCPFTAEPGSSPCPHSPPQSHSAETQLIAGRWKERREPNWHLVLGTSVIPSRTCTTAFQRAAQGASPHTALNKHELFIHNHTQKFSQVIIARMCPSAWMLSTKGTAGAGSACFLPSTPAAACSIYPNACGGKGMGISLYPRVLVGA